MLIDPLNIYPNLVDLKFKTKRIAQEAFKIHLKNEFCMKCLVERY